MNIRFVGGVIAVVLMVGGFAMFGEFEPGGAFYRGNDPISADVGARLQAENPALFGAISRHFPNEYQDFTAETGRMVADGRPAEEIAAHAQAFVAGLLRSGEDALMRAPDTDLDAVMGLSADLHRRIRDGEGRETCNAFAVDGAGALGQRIAPYGGDISHQDALILDAIAAGRDRPETEAAAPATAEDWQTAVERMVAEGGSAADREALATLGPDTDICTALVRLIDTVRALEPPLGARLRASYVRDLAVD